MLAQTRFKIKELISSGAASKELDHPGPEMNHKTEGSVV